MAAGLVRWNFRAFSGLATASNSADERRLLVIYDFASQPFSIGDILVIQQASLVVRQAAGIDRVDLAFVYDPASPVISDPAFAHINPENFLWHLPTVLQAAQVNPYLGSVFLFDSHRRLDEFASGNLHRYDIWPPLSQYASREYLYYSVMSELLFDHFNSEQSLPRLESRGPAKNWAKTFLKRVAGSDIVVTVQLRKNPVNPERDSDYASWISFFNSCQGRYPAKFVVICSQQEVDPELRQCSNVIVAKDHWTSVEQDLALINAAAMHMGASSGPGMLAIFSDKPYCLFNTDVQVHRYRGSTQDGNRVTLYFGSPTQSLLFGAETADVIAFEFERMWKSIARSHADDDPGKIKAW